LGIERLVKRSGSGFDPAKDLVRGLSATPTACKIGLVQTLPTSRDVNSHCSNFEGEKRDIGLYRRLHDTKQKMASGHSNTDKAPTAPRKQISNSLSDERDIRTFSMMTKLSTLSEHTGFVLRVQASNAIHMSRVVAAGPRRLLYNQPDFVDIKSMLRL
jgi:hypothetical protein